VPPPDATETTIAERIGWIREAAGDRFAHIELNINVIAVGDLVTRWLATPAGGFEKCPGRGRHEHSAGGCRTSCQHFAGH
jgi:hypothetical protein